MKRSMIIAGISVVAVAGGFVAWQYLRPADPEAEIQAVVRDIDDTDDDTTDVVRDTADSDIDGVDDERGESIPPEEFADLDDSGVDGIDGDSVGGEQDLAELDPVDFDDSEQGDTVEYDPDMVDDGPSVPTVADEESADAATDDDGEGEGVANFFFLDTETSRVTREGTKVGNAKHTGEITIKTNDLEVSEDMRDVISVAGSVTLDMETIRSTDGAGVGLDNHLKERFDTATYPTAVFEVDSYDAVAQTVTGKLTMHGQTKAITIPNVIVTSDAGRINVKTSVAVDRTLWGVTGGTPAVNKFMTIGLDLAFMAS